MRPWNFYWKTDFLSMRITLLLILLFQLASVILTKNLADAFMFDAEKRFDVVNISKQSSASIMPDINQQITPSETLLGYTETNISVI